MGDFDRVKRSAVVGLAMGCDIAVNYPLWIVAKRVGAGLPAFPSHLSGIYKGGASLWLSLGPTVMVEDAVTETFRGLTRRSNSGWLKGETSELLSAAVSGAVAAVTVASQMEHAITASHVRGTSMLATVPALYREGGLQVLLLPPGMAMMVCREVPFAAALFYAQPALREYVSQHVRDAGGGLDRLGEGEGPAKPAQAALASSTGAEITQVAMCGVATAAVAGPVSHVPSVIAAYQQAHGLGLKDAIRGLVAVGGWHELWRGLAARTVSLAGTMTVVPLVMHYALDSEPSKKQ